MNKQKMKTANIDADTHRKLKLMSIDEEKSVGELISEMVKAKCALDSTLE